MEFRGTFGGEIKSSMEFHGMELDVLLLKFRGIPWNHRCCSNVVQKIPWNSGESSMELFDQNKFQWDFEWYLDT